jgi:hypothetical protein
MPIDLQTSHSYSTAEGSTPHQFEGLDFTGALYLKNREKVNNIPAFYD